MRHAVMIALLATAVRAQDTEATALLSLRDATTNWDAAIAALGGAAWAAGSEPCGSGGGAPPWKGITCSNGAITQLALPNLGLAGTLPPQLAALRSLVQLDLSGNAFEGSIPSAWLAAAAFPSLADADLGRNKLAGEVPVDLPNLASTRISIGSNALDSASLPAAWASASLQLLNISGNELAGLLPSVWASKLPQLASLDARGNRMRGPIPKLWVQGGFAGEMVLALRPGNSEVCGAAYPLNAKVLGTDSAQLTATNLLHTGNVTTGLVATDSGIFGSNVTATVTNWLGSCILACSGQMIQPNLGLPWPPTVTTNLFDLSWQYQMSIADLIRKNPSAATAGPGTALSDLPCYSAGNDININYYGGDVAFGMYAGGNQRAGQEGMPGAMAAAGVVGYLPNRPDFSNPYTGSLGPGGTLVEPVWWFVDLMAPLQVTNIILTANGSMRNASVYVGTSREAVFSNSLVASGLDLAPQQQLAVAANATVGRYVIVYTGTASEGNMSLTDVQVYTVETNAAAFKPVSLSYSLNSNGTNSSSVDSVAAALQSLADNNVSSCLYAAANQSTPGMAWLAVDLGYEAPVGSVALAVGSQMDPGAAVRFYVLPSLDAPLSEEAACSSASVALQPGAWAVAACNITGRIVAASVPANTSGEVCELQVGITAPPADPPSDAASSSLSGGAIAGVVVGSLAALGLLWFLTGYCRWRARFMRKEARREAKRVAAAAEHAKWAEEHGSAAGTSDVLDVEAGQGESSAGTASKESAVQLAVVVGGAALAAAPAGAAGTAGSPADVASGASRRSGVFSHLWGRGKATSSGGGNASELRMLEAYVKSLVQRQQTRSEIEEDEEEMVRFGRHSGAAAVDKEQAATDVSKIPDNFATVLPGDLKLIESVGEGSFGEVWLATYCETPVAVKILAQVKLADLTSSGQARELLSSLKTEAVLMSRLRHPHVCLYFGACTEPPCLVMEYCAKNSLDVLLKVARRDPRGETAAALNWERLLTMALGAAKGMLYLHTRAPPVVHRDLKSANLLVDSQWNVKVADFNLSRQVEINATASTVVMTNPRWLAPEVLAGKPGQLAADVWSYGTVLWELMTWELPYADVNFYHIISTVLKREDDPLEVPLPDQLPAGPFSGYPAYVALLRACRARDPAQRPKFDAIVQQLSALLAEEVRQRRAVDSACSNASAASGTRSLRLATQGAAAGAYAAMLRQRQAAYVGQESDGSAPPVDSGGGVGSAGAPSSAGGVSSGEATGSLLPTLGEPASLPASNEPSRRTSQDGQRMPPRSSQQGQQPPALVAPLVGRDGRSALASPFAGRGWGRGAPFGRQNGAPPSAAG